MESTYQKSELIDLMNKTPRALVTCARSHGFQSLNPLFLSEMAAGYTEDQHLEAEMLYLVAKLMCDLNIKEISYAPLKPFTENFIRWLNRGSYDDIEWEWQPVEKQLSQARRLEKAYIKALPGLGYKDDAKHPLASVFESAATLYLVAMFINEECEAYQLNLKKALCTLIAPPKRIVDSLAL